MLSIHREALQASSHLHFARPTARPVAAEDLSQGQLQRVDMTGANGSKSIRSCHSFIEFLRGGGDSPMFPKVPRFLLGGGFKYFLFSSLPGEMIQFD